MHKVSIILAATLLAASLSGAAPWELRPDTVRFTQKMSQPQAAVDAEGALVVTAESSSDQYDYLVFDFPVTPFQFAGQSLALEFKLEKPLPGDSVYIKCLDEKGLVAASFYTFNRPEKWTKLVCTPGRDSDGVKFFATDVKSPDDPPIHRVRIFLGRRGSGTPVKALFRNFELVASPAAPREAKVTDHGIAVRGGTSRGVIACRDGQGRDVVVVFLMDEVNRRLLQIDAETGACEIIPAPFANPDAVYSSIRARSGKIYSLFGKHFVEYDPAQKKFTFVQAVPTLAAMAMDEDDQGVIWAAVYPDCRLVSFDPAKRQFCDYGPVNTENWMQYPRSLVAASNGWVYLGIGSTAGQIVAFSPSDRKALPLLADGQRPKPGSFTVHRFDDGKVYAVGNKQWFELDGATAKPLASAPAAKMLRNLAEGDQGLVCRDFPSGKMLKMFNAAEGRMEIADATGKEIREVKFSFENLGAPVMAMDVNADGLAAGGGFFPFFFGTFDPATGKKTVELAEVQANTILAHGKYFYIGGYHGGQVLRFDPAKPWNLKRPMHQTKPDLTSNPVFYGRAAPTVNRPHGIAITPDGKTLIVGGTPAYGMTGGGLAVIDLDSGKMTLVPHTALAPEESPFSLAALNNDQLLVGTTTDPGTGGERKAETASLLIYDLKQGKTIWRGTELGKTGVVLQLLPLPDGKVLGLTGERELFLFDPATRKILRRVNVAEYGTLPGAQGPRILLRDGEKVYLLFSSGIAEIDPAACSVKSFVKLSAPLHTGGAIRNKTLYFVGNHQWRSVKLTPEAK